jgi:hypothetical protein
MLHYTFINSANSPDLCKATTQEGILSIATAARKLEISINVHVHIADSSLHEISNIKTEGLLPLAAPPDGKC